MTEQELKAKIFERYPDMVNVRPLAWEGDHEHPASSIVGVIIVSPLHFDGWHHLPVRDEHLRALAARWLDERGGRPNCTDDDAILCLAVIQ
jgi:hypothetical protein